MGTAELGHAHVPLHVTGIWGSKECSGYLRATSIINNNKNVVSSKT